MRVRRRPVVRTKLDLTDVRQVRLVRRHLGVSDGDLARIVAKTGNSLAAISKEVEFERASRGGSVGE